MKPNTRRLTLTGRECLAAWIRQQAVTQDTVAAAIGVSRITLNKYLHGHARPSLAVAFRIQDLAHIPARAWLIEGDPIEALDDGITIAEVDVC